LRVLTIYAWKITEKCTIASLFVIEEFQLYLYAKFNDLWFIQGFSKIIVIGGDNDPSGVLHGELDSSEVIDLSRRSLCPDIPEFPYSIRGHIAVYYKGKDFKRNFANSNFIKICEEIQNNFKNIKYLSKKISLLSNN